MAGYRVTAPYTLVKVLDGPRGSYIIAGFYEGAVIRDEDADAASIAHGVEIGHLELVGGGDAPEPVEPVEPVEPTVADGAAEGSEGVEPEEGAASEGADPSTDAAAEGAPRPTKTARR